MPITVRVRDVMDQNVISVEADKSVSDAIKKMLQSGVWSLVVEKDGLPIGVVTERDTLRRCISKGLNPDKVKVEEIMSSPLITIGPDATLGEAMMRMVEKKIRRLYVVEHGKIIGRITQTGLFENMLNIMMALSTVPYQL
ncbi:MAG: CBS domain-containing protein [Aigarchaeota archaeon]|nr:CBS domain-containing protein [Candidatus Pelearchaeum maunauluense]